MKNILNFEFMLYYLNLVIMLIRGSLYQLLRFKFKGLLLLGYRGRVLGLNNLFFKGIIKIGSFSTLDARFSKGVTLGNRFSLGDFSIMRASGSVNFISNGIRIGDNVSFGPFSNIGGGYGLEIGNNCIFGPYVSIHPEQHVTSDLEAVMRDQGITGNGIIIGTDNWFAAKVTILDGVNVNSGCIFGACSLLTLGSYISNGIFVGVPCRLLKSRNLN